MQTVLRERAENTAHAIHAYRQSSDAMSVEALPIGIRFTRCSRRQRDACPKSLPCRWFSSHADNEGKLVVMMNISETRPSITLRKEEAGRKQDLNRSATPLLHNFKRAIRRTELRQIVPLADTTIYEMEQRGEFPRRFYLTPRCVAWDLAEVEEWLEARRLASDTNLKNRAPSPDVRLRKTRPVRR